jgi:hypothetical protein
MGDKLRDLTPVNVDFSTGEQPTGAKLTGWASQIERGFRTVERLLGDPYSDGHPLFASSNTPIGGWGYDQSGVNVGAEQRHLQIMNLSRLIGPASVLNPRVLTNNTATLTEEVLGGQNTFRTKYRPITFVSFTESLSGVFTTSKGFPKAVVRFGDYHLNETTGTLTYIGAQTGSVGTITYTVDLSDANAGDTYEDATFNVIPDPNQSTKCTVAVSGTPGRYTVTLPVTIDDGQTGWDELGTTLDSNEDPNYGQQATLPTAWATEFTSGDEIPEGLIKLWDGVGNSFLEGQTFYYVSQTSVEVDDVVSMTAGSDQYSVVVVGTDIIRTLDQLRTRFHKHEHRTDDGSRGIDHRYLVGKARGYLTITEKDGGDDLTIGWTENSSALSYNDHPQYLHRYGKDSSSLKGAMFGDILFAPQEWDQGNDDIFHDLGDTYGVLFGKESLDGPRIRGNFNDGVEETLTLLLQGSGGAGDHDRSDGYDSIVLTGTKRIVLDNTGQSTYSIKILSGNRVDLEAGDDIWLTANDEIVLYAADNITLRSNGSDGVRIRDNSGSAKGGRLEVQGNASAGGYLAVTGSIVVAEANDGGGHTFSDGAVHASRGFGNSDFLGMHLSHWWDEQSFSGAAAGTTDTFDVSALVDSAHFSSVVGYQIMVKTGSGADEWKDGQSHASYNNPNAFYSEYDESTKDITIRWTGAGWTGGQNPVVRVVVTYYSQ